jgi:ketosteroid isomerase-like protein
MTRLAALSCALLLAACAAAPQASDPEQMLAALRASTEAWNRGDLRGHLAIYDKSMTAMTKGGPRPGVAELERSFMRTFFRDGKPKQQLRTEQVAIRRLSADAALMTGRFVLTGGGEPEQSGWFTLVWQRTAEGWKVIHDHSS